VISGFRGEVDENCALLGYYAGSGGNFTGTKGRNSQMINGLDVSWAEPSFKAGWCEKY
jgi:hypothetical protein